MSAGLGLFVLVLLVLANAALNAMEVAVIACNPLRVKQLASEGSLRAQSLDRVKDSQERFLAAIVFMVLLTVGVSSFLAPGVSEEIFGTSGLLQTAASVVIVTYIQASIGDLTPKVVGVRAAMRIALLVAPFAELVTRVLAPFIAALGIIPTYISRHVLGLEISPGLTVTEAELRFQIQRGAETGSVAEEEAELLNRVFHFGDRRVHEVMVPRTEVVWLSRQTTVRDFYAIFAEHPHSRFPVYADGPDDVVGVVGIKDVLRAMATGRLKEDSSVEPVMRQAYFVPETKLVGELFRELQANRSQMAVAVDEHGGTAGIVTLEQLLEEMVGRVGDELQPPAAEIVSIDDLTAEVDGSLSIPEAREELGIDIPEGDYDTIAGFVLSVLGRIPIEGETIPLDGHRIAVLEMRGPKIEKLRVTRA
jgi:putative hemolysin